MFSRILPLVAATVITAVLTTVFQPLAFVGTMAQANVSQPTACRTFLGTGKVLCGKFLSYWQGHGGLPQFGYPISNQFSEKSPLDGKEYVVQYFERTVFELHPENKPPYDVLLSLLGSAAYRARYPNGAPSQVPNTSGNSVAFPQTGKRVGGSFLIYWNASGGLSQNGYPISDEFQERSPIDGNTYRVQYFERAVMEWHPGNTPPDDIMLSLLGALRYKDKYVGDKPLPPGARLVLPALPALRTLPHTAVAGNTMFYLRPVDDIAENPSSADSTPNTDIYAFDLALGRNVPITQSPSPKGDLATDGQTLAWTEERTGGFKIIHAYNLSSQAFVAPAIYAKTSRCEPAGCVAVNQGVVYYQDSVPGHEGLFARELATGKETLVDKNGSGPVCRDGVLLWVHREEDRPLSAKLQLSKTTLLGQAITIAEASSPPLFQNYVVSGNTVIYNKWVSGDGQLYIYNLATASQKAVPDISYTPDAAVSGNIVAWTQRLGGTCVTGCGDYVDKKRMGYYTLNENVNHALTPYSEYNPDVVGIVDGKYLLFTMHDNPGSRLSESTYSLFVLEPQQ
jgi:hypothetical protein